MVTLSGGDKLVGMMEVMLLEGRIGEITVGKGVVELDVMLRSDWEDVVAPMLEDSPTPLHPELQDSDDTGICVWTWESTGDEDSGRSRLEEFE